MAEVPATETTNVGPLSRAHASLAALETWNDCVKPRIHRLRPKI
jgi:hypothetical protein